MQEEDYGLWAAENFVDFAENLHPAAKAEALSLAQPIVRMLAFSLLVAAQHNVAGRLNFSSPISSLVPTLVSELRPIDAKHPDETVRSALLASEAIEAMLDALSANTAQHIPADSVLIGFRLGRADVRTIQVSTGLWDVMAEAENNYQKVRQQAEARRAGGAERGKQAAEKADAWKTEALAIATSLDSKQPTWTRDRMATEIQGRLKCEVLPGHKTIEVWLKDEAEQPNGPIRSRARRKSA